MMYRRLLDYVSYLHYINTHSVLDANNIPHPLLTLHRLVNQAHSSLSIALSQVLEINIIRQTLWL